MESTATYGTVVLEEKKKHPKTSWRTPTRAGNEKKPTCQRVGGETQSTTNRFHLPKATHHPEETQNAELFPEAKGLKPMWGTSNVKTCAWETSPQTSCFERQWCSYPRDPQDHSANEGKAHAFGLTAPGLLRRSSRLDFPWQVAYFLVFRWWWRPAGLASQSNTHLDACWNTLWDSRWRAPFSRPSAASRQAEIPRESGLYLLAAPGFPPGFCVCAKGGRIYITWRKWPTGIPHLWALQDWNQWRKIPQPATTPGAQQEEPRVSMKELQLCTLWNGSAWKLSWNTNNLKPLELATREHSHVWE